MGNEGFTVAVREQLTALDTTPDLLLPAIKNLVFAEQPSGFKRVEMKDYRYLFASIQPTGGQKWLISIVAFMLSLGVWALFVFLDMPEIRLPFNTRKTNRNI